MGHDAVSPAQTGPARRPATGQDRLRPDLWSGHLQVGLCFPEDQPLVIGAGWLELERKAVKELVLPTEIQSRHPGARKVRPFYKTEYTEELVAEIPRRSPMMPVIPGSSLKGAVRQAYELLVPSCAWSKPACSVKARQGLGEARLCPACSLFGAAGIMGRLRVHEGVPLQGAKIGKRKVPVAWPPQRPEGGTLRVYDGRRDLDRDDQPRPEVETTYATWGPYRVRLTLLNASDGELGLLFAALGVGWAGPGPGLRVGGKKFHGFGGANVVLERAEARAVRLGEPPVVQAGDAAAAWALGLRDQALDRDPQRRKAWDRLHAALASSEEAPHADS